MSNKTIKPAKITNTIDDVLRDSDSHRLACRKCGTKHDTTDIVKEFFSTVLAKLKAGQEVYIHGFGRFVPKTIAGRKQMVGLPTVTGGEGKPAVEISFGDRLGVKFRISGTAKDELNPKLAKQKQAAKAAKEKAAAKTGK